MVKYTITLNRLETPEDDYGIKMICFDVPEQMYGMIGDILTGKLQVQLPEPEKKSMEDAPVEMADAPSE